jgi:hypothetical protein
MATRQYNVAKTGLTRSNTVTEAVGSAISSGVLQVTVDLAVTATKREVLENLDRISRHIRRGNWPPA